jgi:hypothetical protein
MFTLIVQVLSIVLWCFVVTASNDWRVRLGGVLAILCLTFAATLKFQEWERYD